MLKVLLGLCGKIAGEMGGGGRAGDGLGNEELAKEAWKSRDPPMGMEQGREGEDIESCHRFTHIEK